MDNFSKHLEKGTFISSVSPYPEEEYYLGKSSWSGSASDWDQRFEVGDVVADPSGSWEPSTAEAYIDRQVATLNTGLASEAIARQNGDRNLQTNLTSEMNTRASQDANLNALINAGIREGGGVQFDIVPTQNSANGITSGGMYSTLKDSGVGFVDEVPTPGSSNLAKSGGILSTFTTLKITNPTAANNLSGIIKNVFMVTEDKAVLEELSSKQIRLSYWGIRNGNLGGPLSIFGLQLRISIDEVCTFSIQEVPSIYGNIIQLPIKTNYHGELIKSCTVYVEINENADFNTPTELFFSDGIFVIPSNNYVLSLLKSVLTLSSKSVISTRNDSVVGDFNWLKEDIKIDYRSLNELIQFSGNLFNKNNVIEGYYGYYGSYTAVSNYCATIIPIPLESGSTYTCSLGNIAHFDILDFNNFSFIKHITYLSEGWNVVYDSTNNILSFTVPDDIHCCVIMSILTGNKGIFTVNKGNSLISNRFNVDFNGVSRDYLVVDKSGNGDFYTLTKATDASPDGGVILVMPGVYDNEIIVAGKTKTLFIIGVDRDKCIIKNNDGDYYHAPMHISSGLLRNLTIIEEATTTTNNGSYAVHADFNPLYNSTLRIENCTLQSNVPNTGAIGIGLRGGGTLTIKGCRLIGTAGRALYAHDNNANGYDGEQWLKVEDCIIESPNTSTAIVIQGQGKTGVRTFNESQYYIEFVRNRIKGACSFVNWYQDVTITSDDFQGVMNLRLSPISWGNSNSILNAE